MESRLIVKNFGPIKSVDLSLKNVNVFIGPQASGKSALAKIYTIVKAPRKFLKNITDNSVEFSDFEKSFIRILEEYNIASFLYDDTEIEFSSELHHITYKDGKINYEPRLLNAIRILEGFQSDFSSNKDKIKKEFNDLGSKFIKFNFKASQILSGNNHVGITLNELQNIESLNEDKCSDILSVIREIEEYLSTNTSLYIPAERNFINIIKNSSLNLILNNVPIPKHILSFGAEIEKTGIKEINLDFIQSGLTYKSINGEDRIFTDNQHSIKLTEAASGVQSVIPILMPTSNNKRGLADQNHRSFVIEEPELNLFPLAQYELIKRLESGRNESYWEDYGTIHTYTTHSPYILSAINNLLYATKLKSKVRSLTPGSPILDDINKIVAAQISPNNFTAYQINKGHANSIFDKEVGLIADNYIDAASDKINEDFEALMNIASNVGAN